MNCNECQQHLLDYAYGELPAPLMREMEAAVEACPECQQELADIREVRSTFSTMTEADEMPALARANVLREARKHAATLRGEEQAGFLATLQSWLFHPQFAVAAAILLVIVAAVVLTERDETAVFETAAPKMAEAPGAAADEAAAPATAAVQERPQTVVAAKEEMEADEAADPSPALGEAKPADSLDGQLVAQADTKTKAKDKSWPLRTDNLGSGSSAKPAPKAAEPVVAARSTKAAARAGKGKANVWTAEGFGNAGRPAGTAPTPTPYQSEGPAAAPTEVELAAKADVPNDDGVAEAETAGYDKGLAAYRGGRYGEAIKEFDRYLKASPAGGSYVGEALYHRGLAQAKSGNYSGAVASFRRVLAETPNTRRDETRLQLAKALVKTDPSNEEAQAIFTDLMKSGGGGVSSEAAGYARSYGKDQRNTRRGTKQSNKRKKRAAPRKPSSKKLYDFNEAAGSPTSLE